MKIFLPFLLAILYPWFPLFSREGPAPIPGSLILKFDSRHSIPQTLQIKTNSRQAIALTNEKTLSEAYHIYRFHFDPALDPFTVLEWAQNLPEVTAAQLDYELEPRNIPDDTFFGEQWDLDRIALSKAWDITTGGVTARGDTIVVAITDSGFNPRHLDLLSNLWYNKGEIPGDGLDNDQNGYIDDDQGWNFKQSNNRHPADPHGHKVAGIIGARGNNSFGTAGVNWQVKLMLLTSTKISDLLSAYDYMIDQRKRYNESEGAKGAFVVATNLSLGLSRTFCQDQPVWGEMYDHLGEVGILAAVAAANENYDIEQVGDMPPTCTSNFIIAVTNTTRQDDKYGAAAFGSTSVDLGAPGEGTVTIDLYEEYSTFGGNSAAAPHVAGAIALLYSLPCAYLAVDALHQPAQTALAIRQALLEGVDPLPSLEGKTVTGGRLNIYRSLQLLSQGCSAGIGELSLLKLYPNPSTGLVTIEMQTPDYEDYELIVTNALGQTVYREIFSPLQMDPKKKTVELGSLAAGMYVVSLVNGKDRVSEQLVIR